MIALKKLVVVIDKALNSDKELFDKAATKELRSLTNDALEYLKKTRTFEYSGPIKLNGVAFKLLDLKMDFDDVVKALVDKRFDIEFNGELSLIMEEKSEAKTST